MRVIKRAALTGEGARSLEPTALRRRPWLSAGALVIAIGTLGAVYGANAVATSSAQSSRRTQSAAAAGIASNLQLVLQHEHDLVVSAGAFFLNSPHANEESFLQWADDVGALARYPELLGMGEAVIVPATELAGFEAASSETKTGSGSSQTRFSVIPAGKRPFYCLSVAGLARSAEASVPIGEDLCAGPSGQAMLATRDSGHDVLLPFTADGLTILSLGSPMYRGGAIPTTVTGRHAAFVGWVGMTVVPDVILATAIGGYAHTEVALRFGTGASAVVFTSGRHLAGAQVATVNLHNGWTVETFATASSGSLFSNNDALALLLAGFLLSCLLGTLIYVLGTSRGRAMQLVHERTDQLRFQTLHDSLTGLPNRTLLLDRLGQMIARAERSQNPYAVMFLDLDDFKDINDTLGHDAGDELLIAVSNRLTKALRPGDTAGRLGGDEFILLIEGEALDKGARAVADRILEALERPFEIHASDVPLLISASVGIATGSRRTPGELLRDADIALYRAKAAGKHRSVVFEPSMQAADDDHRHLNVDLHTACAANQFYLLYQPTIEMKTGAINGVEALIRWRHPDRGTVQPNDFIPALEASGMIVPVGAWVLSEACGHGALWQKQGHRFSISVNVSGKQLARDRIVDDVRDALSSSGLDPAMLTLELTETSLMGDMAETIPRLLLLKALGVKIAIDDFGTGYASLAYLRELPVDVLKIDRSFISAMAESAEGAALVHALVQLGKDLHLETVAEGIETEVQRSQVKAEGIDTGQGFLISRPIDVAAVNKLLRISVTIGLRDRLDHPDGVGGDLARPATTPIPV
jgi:diguanylate cyclase (GGDEF)-like protein